MDDHNWNIRDPLDFNFDPDEIYANEPTMFSLALHHGGQFINIPGRTYANARISYVDYCDIDGGFNKSILEDMIKSCGPYPNDMVFYYHFKVPYLSIELGLRSLENDDDFEEIFEHVRRGIKVIDVYVEHWASRDTHWSRSHFTGRAQCDLLLNNLCEVFNKQLVGARDKPIYTCLEYIRIYLQKRIVNVKRKISKSPGPLTPAATKLFTKIKEDASQYNVLISGTNKYQVNGPWSDQVVVDMEQKTCSCRRWDITGMPCRHVVAVIWDMARNNIGSGVAENYVSKVYWLETWKSAYCENIHPSNAAAVMVR